MARINQRLNGLHPLSYLGDNAVQPPDFVTRMYAPTANDSKNFALGDIWLDMSGYPNTLPTANDIYMLVALVGNQATWVPLGGGDIETLTGNSGGAVSPDGANNINIVGDGTSITIVGNPGTNTLTVSAVNTMATSFPTDFGTATPAAGVLNVYGGTAARNINTSGSGNTINIDLDNAITLGDLAVIPAGSDALTIDSGDISVELNNINFVAESNNAGTEGWLTMNGSTILGAPGSNIFLGRATIAPALDTVNAVANICIQAGQSLTTGRDNTLIGGWNISSITSGGQNVVMGYDAGIYLTTGGLNTLIGSQTGADDVGNNGITTGGNNVCIGAQAGANYASNESWNIMIKNRGVLGESGVIRIGDDTNYTDTYLYGDVNLPGSTTSTLTNQKIIFGTNNNRISFLYNSVFIGEQAGNDTLTPGVALFNIGIGPFSLNNVSDGADNTCVGNGTGQNITTGSNNCLYGYTAGNSLTSGSNNVAVGDGALGSITGPTTGSYNTALGFEAGLAYATGPESSNIMINNQGVNGESHVCRIGSGTGTGIQELQKTFIAGIRGVTTDVNNAIPVLIDSAGQLGTTSSSRVYKENIKDMGDASAPIMKLRPVTFNYKKHEAHDIQYGLIAEEVAEIMPELVVNDANGKIYSVKYQDLIPLLLNEVQKLSKEVAELKAKLT